MPAHRPTEGRTRSLAAGPLRRRTAARAFASSSRDVDEVVGRRASELCGEHGATGVSELLGVDARNQAVDLARFEDPPCRIDRERTHVAERVAALCERGARRDHLVDHEVHVTGLGVEVRSEERRHEVCGASARAAAITASSERISVGVSSP